MKIFVAAQESEGSGFSSRSRASGPALTIDHKLRNLSL